jgi:WD40 repeat protein
MNNDKTILITSSKDCTSKVFAIIRVQSLRAVFEELVGSSDGLMQLEAFTECCSRFGTADKDGELAAGDITYDDLEEFMEFKKVAFLEKPGAAQYHFELLRTLTTNVPVNSASLSPIREHILLGGGQEAIEVTTTSAAAGNFEARFFHLVFGEEFARVKGHFGPINTLAFSPNGESYTSGAEDGYCRIHHFDRDYFQLHSEYDDLDQLLNPEEDD